MGAVTRDSEPGVVALERQRQYIAANTKAFKTSDVGAVAELVRVPVLLQWCEIDTVISQGAERSIARFRRARSSSTKSFGANWRASKKPSLNA